MRPEALYLSDMLEAADAIARFIEGVHPADFYGDEMRQAAILQKLIVIGEAAARLPKSLTHENPDVPWPDVVAFRNFAVHEYFSVDWPIVWFTASEEVPVLRQQIAAILSAYS